MKLKFPKITHEVSMGDYDPAMAEVKIDIWVNPPLDLLIELGEEETTVERYTEIIAELLSQGKDAERHWTPEELKTAVEGTLDTDPGWWIWLQEVISKEISDHKIRTKKV